MDAPSDACLSSSTGASLSVTALSKPQEQTGASSLSLPKTILIQRYKSVSFSIYFQSNSKGDEKKYIK